MEQNRLLLLSPFEDRESRATAETSVFRNRLVAALAESIFVAHAEPAGKTEQFCSEVLGWKKPLYTLDGDANTNLLAMGAQPLCPDDAPSLSVLFR